MCVQTERAKETKKKGEEEKKSADLLKYEQAAKAVE